MCVFAVTEPTPGERKAIWIFIVSGISSKLSSHDPSLFTRGKQVVLFKAMQLKMKETPAQVI